MKFPNPFELFEKSIIENAENMNNNEPDPGLGDINANAEDIYGPINTPSYPSNDFSEEQLVLEEKIAENKLFNAVKGLKHNTDPKITLLIYFASVVILLIWHVMMYGSFAFKRYWLDPTNAADSGQIDKLMKDTQASNLWSMMPSIKLLASLYPMLYLMIIMILDTIGGGVNGKDAKNTFIVSLFLFLIIVGSTLALCIIPSFVEIFENSIGYNMLSSNYFSTKTLFQNFSPRIFPNFGINMTFLFTLFTICDFEKTFKQFAIEITKKNSQQQKDDIFYDVKYPANSENEEGRSEINSYEEAVTKYNKLDASIKPELFTLVMKKWIIGHGAWSFFAVVITFFASLKAILENN